MRGVQAGTRPHPGTRPAVAVVCEDPPPGDWRCTWSVRLDPETREPYWELKFIHAGCRLHNKLRAV